MSKSACIINPPTEEENKAALDEFIAEDRKQRNEARESATAAMPAVDRLCEVMRGRSGQPYKVRALLYSLWNGQPVSLVEVVGLDWKIKKDLCAVILAFGYESGPFCKEEFSFFYDAVTAAVKRAGQFEWFLEEHKETE
ncbi:MAG: hypothetical protein ABSE62_04865 [Chthoniobacteraceae bacterium]|jgi:hypothetical protein